MCSSFRRSDDAVMSVPMFPPMQPDTDTPVTYGKDAVLVKTVDCSVVNCAEPSMTAFNSFSEHFTSHADFGTIKYAQWVLFRISDSNKGDALLRELVDRNCDLYGVNIFTHSSGEQMCSAVCRRSQVRKRFAPLNGYGVSDIYTMSVKGLRLDDSNTSTISFVHAWLTMGHTAHANFALRAIEKFTWRDLEKKWGAMALAECEAEMLDAEEKIRLKRKPTETDRVIASMGAKVLKRKRDAMVDYPSFVNFADAPKYINMDDFINLDGIQVKEWNVDNGTVDTYTLTEWLRGSRYKLRTLILHGDSDLGKTQVTY